MDLGNYLYLKKQIVNELVKVNGEVEFHPQYRVQIGDQIEVNVDTRELQDKSLSFKIST